MNLHRVLIVIVAPLVLLPNCLGADENVTALVARGRSEYLAGDAAAAERTFNEVSTLDEHNATSEYYLKRIEQERNRTRLRMLAEVDQAWRPPAIPATRAEASSAATEVSPLW